MNIWRTLFGCTDFEHFVAWCPGCFGIMVGLALGLLICLPLVFWLI